MLCTNHLHICPQNIYVHDDAGFSYFPASGGLLTFPGACLQKRSTEGIEKLASLGVAAFI